MPPKQAPEVKAANPMVEKLLGIHNSLPLYYYVFIVLPLVWGLLYLFGLLRYLVAWYFFCLFFSPHASWETCKFYLLRSLRPYKHYPIYFNITPLGVLCSRFFLIFPFDTLLYYIDEIIFPGYKNVEIKDPFLVVGQPRSGTTKFESILEEDHDMVCMKLYECRFPYLCFQFAVDAICRLDATYLNGAIEKFVNDYQILHAFDETNPERSTMRRLRFNLSDEDDTIFLFHFFVHFQIYGAFPDPECTRYSHYFENLSTIEKKRMMEFHKKAVQKLLYRKGPNKRYFGKWVLAWCGAVQEAMKVYPDLKIVVMVREPEDQLRSWFKLQGLLSKDLTGYNVMIHSPEVREEAKKINLAFYHKEIDFLKNMSKDRYFLMNFADYYGDIQGNSRHIYKFLGKEIVEGSSLDKFLKEQTQQQRTHKATVTDDSLITSDEIKKFPDLPRIFFEENFSKTD